MRRYFYSYQLGRTSLLFTAGVCFCFEPCADCDRAAAAKGRREELLQRFTRLIERWARVATTRTGRTTAKWPRWAAITTVLGLDAVIVASHQLTPYMLLVSLALLMLTGVVRPWWLLIATA